MQILYKFKMNVVFVSANLRKTCKRAVIAATINYVLHFSTIQQIVMNFNIFISINLFSAVIVSVRCMCSLVREREIVVFNPSE